MGLALTALTSLALATMEYNTQDEERRKAWEAMEDWQKQAPGFLMPVGDGKFKYVLIPTPG